MTVKSKKPGKKNTATKPQNKYNIPQIRWRRIGNKYLVSNDFGRYVILGEMDFKKLLDNKITEKDKNYQLFVSNGFIKNNMDIKIIYLVIDLFRYIPNFSNKASQ